jgi:hypothetical protein
MPCVLVRVGVIHPSGRTGVAGGRMLKSLSGKQAVTVSPADQMTVKVNTAHKCVS